MTCKTMKSSSNPLQLPDGARSFLSYTPFCFCLWPDSKHSFNQEAHMETKFIIIRGSTSLTIAFWRSVPLLNEKQRFISQNKVLVSSIVQQLTEFLTTFVWSNIRPTLQWVNKAVWNLLVTESYVNGLYANPASPDAGYMKALREGRTCICSVFIDRYKMIIARIVHNVILRRYKSLQYPRNSF